MLACGSATRALKRNVVAASSIKPALRPLRAPESTSAEFQYIRARIRHFSSAHSSNAPSTVKMEAHKLATRLEKFGAMTVWQEFTPLAKETGAINLGQGFPDWASPRFVKDAMIRAVNEEHNQYTRSAGHPALVQALAKQYSSRLGRALNWETEVTVGVGSSECLFAIMQSLVNPGDEVVLISPAFDIYSAQVIMAGGKPVYVPLRVKGEAEGWSLDLAELRAAFNERTRVVIINTPQNPTGKMMTREELEGVAAILRDNPRVVAVSDEVYEHMTYSPADDALIGASTASADAAAVASAGAGGASAVSKEARPHLRLASLEGMWERCLTVSSAGKTFSITGWKIGWVIGHEALVKGVILTNQWVQFSVSTPAQQAVAYCLEQALMPYEGHESYFHWLRAQYARKRAVLADGLKAAGLTPIIPEGGFFIMADTSAVDVPASYMAEHSPACGDVMRRDWAFCRFLCKEIGVAAIPPSAFFEERDKDLAKNLARFAFCKEDASIEEACRRLLKLRHFLKK